MLTWIVEFATQIAMKPERPESFWPLSIAGWVAVVTGLSGWIIALRRANNKPILDEMVRLEKEFKDIVTRLERDFTQKINGLGRRVTDNREDLNRLEDAQGAQANELIRSVEDRKQMNTRLTQSEMRQEAQMSLMRSVESGLRDKIDQQIDQQRKALEAQTEKLMAAIREVRDHRRT